MNKKTIKLFLMDGEIDGRMRCDVSNSNLVAYKIPRNMLKECKGKEDFEYRGVYILFGEKDGKEAAYIGETKGIYKRLAKHSREKDFWNEALVFVRNDDSFHEGNTKYIENKLFKIAKKAKRYLIETTLTEETELTESEYFEMEETIDLIKMITSVLGYKIFNEIANKKQVKPDNLLYIDSVGLHAVGAVTNEGFVVFKGSQSNPKIKEACSECYKRKWKELRDMKIVDKNNIFKQDKVFKSASTAAVMVLGRHTNGLKAWKNSDGKKLREIMNENEI